MKAEHGVTNVVIHRSEDRGRAQLGWLDARHSFSFGEYYDPRKMGYRSLRVINQDIVSPGKGFGTHPHRSMEIFTVPIRGQLAHKDSLGNGRVIEAGDFQYMSAGTGVMHSEFNPSDSESTELLQIWIEPTEPGGAPRYEDRKAIDQAGESGLKLLASGTGRDGSVEVRQVVEIFVGRSIEESSNWGIPWDAKHRYVWIQVIEGVVSVAGHEVRRGDALAFEGSAFELEASEGAYFLLFRLS